MLENLKSQAELDDMVDHPERYGLPSFEEFCKNPESFRQNAEQLFEVVDQGGTQLKLLIREHEYRILGYKCRKLEEVQKIMLSEGVPFDQWDIRPELERVTAGKVKVIVTFVPKRPVQENATKTP